MSGPTFNRRRNFPSSNLMSALAVILVIFGTRLLGVNGILDPEDERIIKENIQFITDVKTWGDDTQCFSEYIQFMIGELPTFGDTPTDSALFRFEQAYHSVPPGPAVLWPEFSIKVFDRRQFVIEARDLQRVWSEVEKFYNDRVMNNNCSGTLTQAAALGKDDEEEEMAVNMTIKICKEVEIIKKITGYPREKFEEDTYRTCYRALWNMADALLESTEAERIRGFKAWWKWNHFDQMYQETLAYDLEIHERLTNSFPAFIQKLRDDGKMEEADKMQDKLDEIRARLKDSSLPYKDIYFDGDEDEIYDARYSDLTPKSLELFYGEIYDFLYEDYLTGTSFDDAVTEWDEEDIAVFVQALNDGTFETYFDEFYYSMWESFLEVKSVLHGTEMYNAAGVLVGDAKWDWEYQKKPIHNLRLAWDLLGAVLEELKCYMRETYWFDLRMEALRRTQRNLTKGALYSGFSKTIHTPCRIVDDLDLVGPDCTRENNEICSPISTLGGNQRTNSDHHGGQGLLKPRWIYKYDPETYTCKGRKDYAMRVNFCRCGFRLDCGADLNVSMACQLQNNDLLRGQCRGGVGYPCVTLPLAPGKHNQTCVSGYCNEKKNSCEDRPYVTRHTSSGAKLEMKLAVKVLVGLMMCLMGFMYPQLI